MRRFFKKFDDIKEVFSNDFPSLKCRSGKIVYLDNANRTLIPIQVMDVIYDYNTRSKLMFSEEGQEIISKCKRKIADFIRIKDHNNIFVYSCYNTILHILLLKAINTLGITEEINDRLILLQPSCYSNENIYLNEIIANKKDLKVQYLKLRSNGEIDTDFLKEFNKPAITIIQYVDHITGAINPINEIIKAIHENRGLVFLDCSLAAAHIEMDQGIEKADIIFVMGDKMLAPHNSSFVWLNPNSQLYNKAIKIARTYESSDLSLYAGLSMAVDYLKAIGKPWIMKHENELANALYEYLIKMPQVKIVYPDRENKIGIISMYADDNKLEEVNLKFIKNNIYVGYGDLNSSIILEYLKLRSLMRISVYIYNWIDDIEKFIEVFQKSIA